MTLCRRQSDVWSLCAGEAASPQLWQKMRQSVKPGDLIHADVCGPMQKDSFRGYRYRYFVNFKDDYSKYKDAYFMKNKSEVSEKLKYFLAKASTMGQSVWELLTDGGGEFNNIEFEQITQNAEINHRITMPYTVEQNSATERENHTLVETARSMLQSKQLPNKLWAETCQHSGNHCESYRTNKGHR